MRTEMTQSATGFLRAASAVSFSLVSSMAVTCSMLNTFSSSIYMTCGDGQHKALWNHHIWITQLNRAAVKNWPHHCCLISLTLIPVVPVGIWARSKTRLGFTAWTYGSLNALPWNRLKPCTVFLQFVTTLLWEQKVPLQLLHIHAMRFLTCVK